MDTYFFVSVLQGSNSMEFGPYISFKEAADVMLNHVDVFLQPMGGNADSYTVSIVEVHLQNSTWQNLNTRVEERRERR